MATIIVTGVGGPAGRAVAQMVYQRGHAVIGTDMQPGELPVGLRLTVPAATSTEFPAALRAIADAHHADLVIPTVSEELPVLSDAHPLLADLTIAVGPHRGVFLANDKHLTCAFLSAHGVAVPRFMLPSEAVSTDVVAERIGWPCLSKPRVSRGGRGVTLHESSDLASLAGLDDGTILQEFVPGAEYAPNVYLGHDGSTRVVVLEKTALRGGRVGNALAVRRVEAPDVAALAVAAGRALSLTGPIDVDIRRRAAGTPVVLEVNARFGANSAYAHEILDALLVEYGVARTRAMPERP